MRIDKVPFRLAVHELQLMRISIVINILAVAIWLYGMYIWMFNPYTEINLGKREGYIGGALTGFMLFVLRSDLADEYLKGLSFYVTIFGFSGLIIIVCVLKAYWG